MAASLMNIGGASSGGAASFWFLVGVPGAGVPPP
jgi:hypothetical protein